MKIAIGSDHAGFDRKRSLASSLAATGHEIVDVGCDSSESCDYPDFARAVALAVSRHEVERGILVCGSGTGMAMAANRVPGVRAVQAWSLDVGRMSRLHNDSNVACFGSRVQSAEDISEIAAAWLRTEFEGGRHATRVEKMG